MDEAKGGREETALEGRVRRRRRRRVRGEERRGGIRRRCRIGEGGEIRSEKGPERKQGRKGGGLHGVGGRRWDMRGGGGRMCAVSDKRRFIAHLVTVTHVLRKKRTKQLFLSLVPLAIAEIEGRSRLD